LNSRHRNRGKNRVDLDGVDYHAVCVCASSLPADHDSQ
jgi:hypothetical protein